MDSNKPALSIDSINKTITVFVSLYSLTLWINFIITVNTGKYNGDLMGIDVGQGVDDLFYIALLNQFFLLLAIVIFRLLNSKNVTIGNVYFFLNERRFSIFFFIIVVLSMIFFYSTGVGKVYSTKTHVLKPLFLIIEPGNIFFLYYLLVRKSSEKLFFINVGLYSILQISKGWTSFILMIGMFELYFFILKHNASRFFKIPLMFSLIVPVVLLACGGFVYKYAFLMKNEVRGVSVESVSLTYTDSITLLASRLSNYTISAGVNSRLDRVVSVVKQQGEFSELKSFANFSKYFIPNSSNDVEARPLSNSVMLAFYPMFGAKYSNVEIGMFTYYQTLFKVDACEAVFVAFITFFMLITLFFFYKIITNNNKHVELLLFCMVFYFLYTMCSPVYFIKPYITGVFLLPFLFMFGVFKIKKRY
ncbi:oligosaccharide repeat unit polymerase [Yersinia nurmii]|uniref:Oligosaccharide repeat unit polymerase n=1 Tax=Yersinia nurmii TaxID=685706 RepID=A0AAW7K0I3_9GAMM|nr:oligosaccharide repeat unit polymerase [Yersinia nurmii]MDN0088603.1 oligosaccharide repeat unit polymerase [Yersinia nurmii]